MSKDLYEQVRILSRCPSCKNDTLVVNDGHLLCTWHECEDPTLIDDLEKADVKRIPE